MSTASPHSRPTLLMRARSPRTAVMGSALSALLAWNVFAATSLASAAPPAAAGSSQQSSNQPGGARPDLLARGRTLFEDQQYEESIQTLSAALLRPGKTKQQTLDIYRYLALNYITLNRRDEAESAVRGLLAQDPSYALAQSESPRFRDFFDATRAKWEAEGRPGLVTATAVETKPVVLRHAAPGAQEERTAVELSLRIEDPEAYVASIKLFYRTGSRGKFESKPLDLQSAEHRPAAATATAATTTPSIGGLGPVAEPAAPSNGVRLHTTIPSSAVRAPLVEYYFAAYDAGGLPVATRGDATDPLRIAVSTPSKGWVLPVIIGGSVLGAAAIVGGLALGGVFKSSAAPGPTPPPPVTPRGTVTIIVGD